MYVLIIDGLVTFATHIVKASINIKEMPFNVESEGIICYSEGELFRAKAMLDGLKIKYTIDDIVIPENLKQISDGVVYASRTEAMGHLLEGKEPESKIIPSIGKALVNMELEKLQSKQETDLLGSQLVALELKVLELSGVSKGD